MNNSFKLVYAVKKEKSEYHPTADDQGILLENLNMELAILLFTKKLQEF